MHKYSRENIYDISLMSINNKMIDLHHFKGKYILFVNVASYCGYTSQYSDLQKLYKTYNNLEIIGLPCNQFLFQEPFSENKIRKFCSLNYGVTFLMSKKILLVGASGLVGSNLLHVLKKNESELVLLSRKKLENQMGIEQIIINFDDIKEINYQETLMD